MPHHAASGSAAAIASSGDMSSPGKSSKQDFRIKDYMIGDCIGKGGFGSVHKGLHATTGATVAIKLVKMKNKKSSNESEVMSEISLLSKLNHANIVKYVEFVKTKEYLCIVLEYIESGSLQSVCNKFGQIPETLVVLYIAQVLEGLNYLHESGVIHRDIKGANILITKNGTVKLADFGVAAKLSDIEEGDEAVVGTPYWMAPEIIEIAGVSTASDIWSVGCTVIELTTGLPPYHKLAPMTALFRIVQDDHPPLPAGISNAMEDFLMHCFQKDPNLRIPAKKLLRHGWITKINKKREVRDATKDQSNLEGQVQVVKQFNEYMKEDDVPATHRNDPSKHVIIEDSKRNVEVAKEVKADAGPTPPSKRRGKSVTTINAGVPNVRAAISSMFSKSSKRKANLASSSPQSPKKSSAASSDPKVGMRGHKHSVSSVTPTTPSQAISTASPAEVTSKAKKGVIVPVVAAAPVGDLVSQCSDEDNWEAAFDGKSLCALEVLGRTESNGSLEADISTISTRTIVPAAAGSLSNTIQYNPKIESNVERRSSDIDSDVKTLVANKSFVDHDDEENWDNDFLDDNIATLIVRKSDNNTNSMLSTTQRIVASNAVTLGTPTVTKDKSTFRSHSVGGSRSGVVEEEDEWDGIELGSCEFAKVAASQQAKGLVLIRPSELPTTSSPQHALARHRESDDADFSDLVPHAIDDKDQGALRLRQPVTQSSSWLDGNADSDTDFDPFGTLDNDMGDEDSLVIGNAFPIRNMIKDKQSQVLTRMKELIGTITVFTTYEMLPKNSDDPTDVAFFENATVDTTEDGAVRSRVKNLNSLSKTLVKSPRNIVAAHATNVPSRPRCSDNNNVLALFTPPNSESSSVKSSTSKSSKIVSPSVDDKSLLEEVEEDLVVNEACDSFVSLMNSHPLQRKSLSAHESVLPLIEIIHERCKRIECAHNIEIRIRRIVTLLGVMRVLNSVIAEPIEPRKNRPSSMAWANDELGSTEDLSGDDRFDLLDASCSLGSVPAVMRVWQCVMLFLSDESSIADLVISTATTVALFFRHIVTATHASVHAFIACGALETLVAIMNRGIISPETGLMPIAVQSVRGVFESYGTKPKTDLCRLFTRSGLLEALVGGLNVLVDRIIVTSPNRVALKSGGTKQWNQRENADLIDAVAKLLLVFSQTDPVVKAKMAFPGVLGPLVGCMDECRGCPADVRIKLLKALKHLTMDPALRPAIGAVPSTLALLLRMLKLRRVDSGTITDVHNQALTAVFNLVRFDRKRMAEVAEGGIIEDLKYLIDTHVGLKHISLQVFCDMVRDGRNYRQVLWDNQCLEYFVDLLTERLWAVPALDALGAWLSEEKETQRVEETFLKNNGNVEKLCMSIVQANPSELEKMMIRLLAMLNCSERVCKAVGISRLVSILIDRLNFKGGKPTLRLVLLQTIIALYRNHDNKVRFLENNDLTAVFESLHNDPALMVSELAKSFQVL